MFKNKKDIKNICYLVLISIILILVMVNFTNLFGSMKDYVNQHMIFPDYFRKLFYDTFNFFPSLAFNIGSGQNIFNFSYYGLFNPIIMISYLLPFIPMVIYMQLSMVIVLIVSVILMYIFLRDKFSSEMSFIGSLLFVLATPFIFHLHRHIMFVDYMPFLLLAFISLDKYFKSGKVRMLLISMVLMILTSYYFSIGGLLALFIYGVYKYFSSGCDNKKAGKLLFVFVESVLLSAFLLVPTFLSLLSGRTKTNIVINKLGLLIPSIKIDQLFYSPYTIGLSAVLLFSLYWGCVNKNKNIKILCSTLTVILVFPLFNYLLNGGMYLNGKAFIPFLPLLIFVITLFLDKYNNDFKIKGITILVFIIIITNIFYFVKIANYLYLLFIIDMVIFLIVIKYHKEWIKYYLVGLGLAMMLCFNFNDSFIKRDYYKSLDYDNSSKKVMWLLDYDKSFYRISDQGNLLDKSNYVYDADYYTSSVYSSLSNPYYKDFYNKRINNEFMYRSYGMLTNTNNIFYHFYMGNKYLLNGDLIGYHKIKDGIYENDDVLSVGYVTDKIMGENEYNSLNYFEKVDAYLNYAIVPYNKNFVYEKKIDDNFNDYDLLDSNNVVLKKDNDSYLVNAKKGNKVKFKVNDVNDSDILLIRFKVINDSMCQDGDLKIMINGVLNTLTCKEWKYHNNNYYFEYSIVPQDGEVDVEFIGKKFKIKDIKVAKYSYNNLKEIKYTVDPLIIEKEKTKGDNIYGKVNVNSDGYLKLSIPYDDGYTIKVDNKKVKYIAINKDFIGFKVKKGVHDIVINYQAKGLKEGIIISVLGFFLLLIFVII